MILLLSGTWLCLDVYVRTYSILTKCNLCWNNNFNFEFRTSTFSPCLPIFPSFLGSRALFSGPFWDIRVCYRGFKVDPHMITRNVGKIFHTAMYFWIRSPSDNNILIKTKTTTKIGGFYNYFVYKWHKFFKT